MLRARCTAVVHRRYANFTDIKTPNPSYLESAWKGYFDLFESNIEKNAASNEVCKSFDDE